MADFTTRNLVTLDDTNMSKATRTGLIGNGATLVMPSRQASPGSLGALMPQGVDFSEEMVEGATLDLFRQVSPVRSPMRSPMHSSNGGPTIITANKMGSPALIPLPASPTRSPVSAPVLGRVYGYAPASAAGQTPRNSPDAVSSMRSSLFPYLRSSQTSVDQGEGNDTVVMEGKGSVDQGSGDDMVLLDSAASKSARVHQGSGNDLAVIGSKGSIDATPTRSATSAPVKMTINQGSGDDVVVHSCPSKSGSLGSHQLKKSSEASYANYESMIQNASIEQELMAAGFYPKDKIITTSDDGDSNARFIKAVTKMGHTVLVELDVEGYVAVDPKDHTMIETKSVTVVPYSVKSGAQQCMGSDVCGVAFVCADGVCTMINDDTGHPKEANYTFVEKLSEKAVIIDDNPVAYPIVRLSEIRASPVLVIKSISEANRRIRNASYKAVAEDLSKTDKAIEALEQNYKAFKTLNDRIAADLSASIKQLESFNMVYMKTPPISEAEKLKHRKVIANLKARQDKVVELLRLGEKVASHRDEIAEIAKEFGVAARYLQNGFRYIDREWDADI